VVDGYGNFVWLPVGDSAETVASQLRNQGVLIKAVVPHGVRITVGTPKDTDTVCTAWERADLTNIIAVEKAVKFESIPDIALEGGAV
jgi:histidinol-phosphate/aromatic aminotransferase/cobyric acid decarboxylase-like protein